MSDEPIRQVIIKDGEVVFQGMAMWRWTDDGTVFKAKKIEGGQLELVAHGYGELGTSDGYGNGCIYASEEQVIDVNTTHDRLHTELAESQRQLTEARKEIELMREACRMWAKGNAPNELVWKFPPTENIKGETWRDAYFTSRSENAILTAKNAILKDAVDESSKQTNDYIEQVKALTAEIKRLRIVREKQDMLLDKYLPCPEHRLSYDEHPKECTFCTIATLTARLAEWERIIEKLKLALIPKCCHISGEHDPEHFTKEKYVCTHQKSECFDEARNILGMGEATPQEAEPRPDCGWCNGKYTNGKKHHKLLEAH